MKYLLIIISFSFSSPSIGQENVLKDWRLKSALAFSPGFLTENTKTVNLHGYIGGVHNNKIEWRGDGFYFLNSFGKRPRFSINHQLYAGAFYHFLDKYFQPYVGFQPGVAFSKSSEFGVLNIDTGQLEYKTTINPVGSLIGGFDLYAQKWFFMFIEGRYIYGKHKSNSYPVYLDEFRLSFGFGFTL
jgi:hypothetical protein